MFFIHFYFGGRHEEIVPVSGYVFLFCFPLC